MREDVDAREFDCLLEVYLNARLNRQKIGYAIPEKYLVGTKVDRLNAYLVSYRGSRLIEAERKALKLERKTLRQLQKFAQLKFATAKKEP